MWVSRVFLCLLRHIHPESGQRSRLYALQYLRNDVTVRPAKSPAGIKLN